MLNEPLHLHCCYLLDSIMYYTFAMESTPLVLHTGDNYTCCEVDIDVDLCLISYCICCMYVIMEQRWVAIKVCTCTTADNHRPYVIVDYKN